MAEASRADGSLRADERAGPRMRPPAFSVLRVDGGRTNCARDSPRKKSVAGEVVGCKGRGRADASGPDAHGVDHTGSRAESFRGNDGGSCVLSTTCQHSFRNGIMTFCFFFQIDAAKSKTVAIVRPQPADEPARDASPAARRSADHQPQTDSRPRRLGLHQRAAIPTRRRKLPAGLPHRDARISRNLDTRMRWTPAGRAAVYIP